VLDGAGGQILYGKQAPEILREFMLLSSEVQRAELLEQTLRMRFEQARIDEERVRTDAIAYDEAVPPNARAWPSRRAIVSIAFLIGVLASVLYVTISLEGMGCRKTLV
jgi:uncharacterized protein involved in exopolysaccharide biosynthesis